MLFIEADQSGAARIKSSPHCIGALPMASIAPQLDPLPVLRLASRSLTFLRIWYSGNPVIPIIALSDKRRNVFYIVITNLWPIAQKGGDLLAAVHKSYQYFSFGKSNLFRTSFFIS